MKSFVFCIFLPTFAVLAAASDVPSKVGQLTYEKHCVACHGKDGGGKTAAGERMPIPDLRGHAVVSLSDQELADSIGRGVQHKVYPHSFLLKKDVTKDELQALVGYIRTLQKK
ncbi:MAG TPA: cytochrome c [Candidatus Acidoferrales bacterium]|nr:cytochrome c [Candidatus Acidoferrales bacterium]